MSVTGYLLMSITFHTAHTSGDYFVKLTPVQAAKVKVRGSAPGLQCNVPAKPPVSAEASQISTKSTVPATIPPVKRSESLREDRAFKKPPELEFDYFSPLERYGSPARLSHKRQPMVANGHFFAPSQAGTLAIFDLAAAKI